MRPYVGDGHDLTFFVKGEPGLYPDCRFAGRLMAYHEAAPVLMQTSEKPDEAHSVFAEAIARKLTGWSYKDDAGQWRPFDKANGDRLEITPANVGGLSFNLFCRLRDIVLGVGKADTDPESKQAAKTPGENEKN